MSEARVVKMVCPCCEGTGDSIFSRCMWCGGSRETGGKRVPIETALRFANHIFMLAGGGYIAGDHDLKDMRAMEVRAKRIYDLARVPAPWECENHG